MQETKTQRDQRLAAETKSGMSDRDKEARTNFEGKLRVYFTDEATAIVHVTQRGMPHPKGLDAVIVSTYGGGRLDGEMNQRIKDAALNYARGKTTEWKVEKYVEEKSNEGTKTSPPASEPPTADQSGRIEIDTSGPNKDASGTVYEECSAEDCKAVETKGVEDSSGPGVASGAQ